MGSFSSAGGRPILPPQGDGDLSHVGVEQTDVELPMLETDGLWVTVEQPALNADTEALDPKANHTHQRVGCLPKLGALESDESSEAS